MNSKEDIYFDYQNMSVEIYAHVFQGVIFMFMNGENLENISDLKRCFCLDELLYSYYNGELEIFLEMAGEHEKAEQVRNIPENNALLLLRLYDIFDLPFEDSEEKIRSDHALNL